MAITLKKKNDKLQPYWYQGLTSGMDQSTDPSLVSNNESPLLLNVTLDQPGNWATRLGSTLVKAKIGANPGYGLWSYNTTAGVHKLLAVTDRDLYVLDESTGWGAAVDTDEWPADTRVDGIDFLNRSYIGSEDGATPLAYTTGSAITDVVPTIGGSKLAVNKSILAVGGNSIKPNVVFYTNPFTDQFFTRQSGSDSGTCAANADVNGAGTVVTTAVFFEADITGAILYNTTDGTMVTITEWVNATIPYVKTDGTTSTWDNDTIYVMKNVFKQDNACTGIVSFGEQFVSFDENKMYVFDPTAGNWSKEKEGFGCVNYRTIKVVNGVLIWVNRDGVWMYTGEGDPVDITSKIRDRINFNGVWDLIDSTYWTSMAAGVQDSLGKYWLSVGTLQTKSGALASALTNVALVFDTKKGAWTVRTYQDRFLAFTKFINSTGNKGLYTIGDTDAAVWLLDQNIFTDALSDGSSTQAITVKMYTQHNVWGDPRVANLPRSYWAKFSSDNAITVTYSKNRTAYTTLASLTANSVIGTTEFRPAPDGNAWSHSLCFATTGKFILEAYGALVESGETTTIPPQ